MTHCEKFLIIVVGRLSAVVELDIQFMQSTIISHLRIHQLHKGKAYFQTNRIVRVMSQLGGDTLTRFAFPFLRKILPTTGLNLETLDDTDVASIALARLVYLRRYNWDYKFKEGAVKDVSGYSIPIFMWDHILRDDFVRVLNGMNRSTKEPHKGDIFYASHFTAWHQPTLSEIMQIPFQPSVLSHVIYEGIEANDILPRLIWY